MAKKKKGFFGVEENEPEVSEDPISEVVDAPVGVDGPVNEAKEENKSEKDPLADHPKFAKFKREGSN